MNTLDSGGGGAARFLLAMGARVAPEVLGRLKPAEARASLLQVARIAPDLGYVYLDPGVEATAWLATHRALSQQGPEQARRMAERLEGTERADAVLETVDSLWDQELRDREQNPGGGKTGSASEDGEDSAFENMPRESGALAEVLFGEKSEGVALALTLAPRALGRRALVDLVELGREDFLAWFAGLQHVYPGVLAPEEMGEDVLSELLDGLRTEVRAGILVRLERVDPGLVERINARRFSIRELEDLDDDGLGQLMSAMPAEDLALALREAPQALRRRCLEAMPRGLRRGVLHGLESEQPVRLRDLSRARERMGSVYLQHSMTREGVVQGARL